MSRIRYLLNERADELRIGNVDCMNNPGQIRLWLPAAQQYRLIQSVYLKPDFELGGKNEGGKPGFGFDGGSVPSGGVVATEGFTARSAYVG